MSLIRGGTKPRGVLVDRSRLALESDLERLRLEAESKAAAAREDARQSQENEMKIKMQHVADMIAEKGAGVPGGFMEESGSGGWRARVRRNVMLPPKLEGWEEDEQF